MLQREAALPRHLEAVKDYFLLGAGNVFQTFLQEASRDTMLTAS